MTQPNIAVGRARGFTLVELLVSMAVLSLVMVITVQLVGKATSITTASNKILDTATMARTVFDRLGDDLASAALSNGQTVLYYSGSSGTIIDPAQNSSLAFVCKTRARKIGSVPAAVQDVRGVIVGYKIRPTTIIRRLGSTLTIPLINRGDAEFTYQAAGNAGSNGNYGFNIWDMFGAASVTSLPNDLSTTTDTKLLTWQAHGDGVLRFHISFVLDDGRIVQSLQQGTAPPAGITVPPGTTPYVNATYNGFQSNGGTGDCLPVAFSSTTTKDAYKHYVTGMIIGIVVLDQTSVNFGYSQDANFASTLASQLKRPVNDGETPLGVWQKNLATVTSTPVRQNLRFYQRFYTVNL